MEDGRSQESGQEERELERMIFELRDTIVRTYLLQGNRLAIPITPQAIRALEDLDPIVVVETDEIPLPGNNRYRLLIFADGRWGDQSGYFGGREIGPILQGYAAVVDPTYQQLDRKYWDKHFKILDAYYGGLTTDREINSLLDRLHEESEQRKKQYLETNKLPLMKGLQLALRQTLQRLQSSP